MTARFAHTVVLPPVTVAGQQLMFFCDLTRDTAIDELIANIETWLDLQSMPEAEQAILIGQGFDNEDSWYELAAQRMRANCFSLQSDAYRARCLARLRTDFFPKHAYPEVEAALAQLFPVEENDCAKKTACLH